MRPDMRPPVRAPVQPIKSTTVWVGKIATSVEIPVIKGLLEACGPVKTWKPQVDPDTQLHKGFAICEFEDAEGVLRALRLLNGVKVDGQELQLKANSATQKYVEFYEAKKEDARREEAEKRAQEQEQGEIERPVETDEDGDNKVLETIMSMISEREAGAAKKAVEAQQATADLRAIMSQDKGPVVLPPPPPIPPELIPKAAKGYEKERERERQRREIDYKHKESDREYDTRLREWERYERDKIREYDKERERERDSQRERARQLRIDQDMDTDDELPQWQRRPYRLTKRAEERKKRRLQEAVEDDADREKEGQQEAQAQRRRLEAEAAEHSKQVEVVTAGEGPELQDSKVVEPKPEDLGNIKVEQGKAEKEEMAVTEGTALHLTDRPKPGPDMKLEPLHEPDIDPNDPIYLAMIAAAKAGPMARSPGPAVATPPLNAPGPLTGGPALLAGPMDPGGLAAPGLSSSPEPHSKPSFLPAVKKPMAVRDMFGDDEDDQKQRKLVSAGGGPVWNIATGRGSFTHPGQQHIRHVVRCPLLWGAACSYGAVQLARSGLVFVLLQECC